MTREWVSRAVVQSAVQAVTLDCRSQTISSFKQIEHAMQCHSQSSVTVRVMRTRTCMHPGQKRQHSGHFQGVQAKSTPAVAHKCRYWPLGQAG
eukprot:363888-Chlamydomonas_euryale.AAC.9